MTHHSATLYNIIREKIITQDGKITFADFMQTTLYHPTLGYYNNLKTIGAHGDFTTAPEISSLFAYCYATQCAEILPALAAMHILELGAGTGKFAADFLRAMTQLGIKQLTYFIYEPSPSLKHQQQLYLQTHAKAVNIIWLDALPENFNGIIIANEVFDALPFHCFAKQAEGMQERYVCLDNQQLYLSAAPASNQQIKHKLQALDEQFNFPLGYCSEINLQAEQLLASIAHSLQAGVILISDYGYAENEYYRHARNQGTLSCFHQHQYTTDPFAHLGQQDITAHVNFSVLAGNQDLQLSGYTTQAGFLLACDLMSWYEYASANLTEHEIFNLHQAIKTLLMPASMGEVIKVMALSKQIQQPLTGFALQDRCRDL